MATTWGVWQLLLLLRLWSLVPGALVPGFRPPCTPLNVVSPYQSVWSCYDHLYDGWPSHWTGSTIGWAGLLRVDGATFRFMGPSGLARVLAFDGEEISADSGLPTSSLEPVAGTEQAVEQISLTVAPTTTTYVFQAAGVQLTLNFTTPMLGLDEDIVSATRPLTHMSFSVVSVDGSNHSVGVYFDTTAEPAIDSPTEFVSWKRLPSRSLKIMQIGTTAQNLLGSSSDQISWGHWLVAVPTHAPGLHTAMVGANTARAAFQAGTYNSLKDDIGSPRPASFNWPVLSVAWEFSSTATPQESHLIMAYDQVLSMRYFGTDMEPLWRHHWDSPAKLLEDAEKRRQQDLAAAASFDADLIAKTTAAGGDKYATLASLVYRQTVGGTQSVWNPVLNKPWVFMKEISSDGDVSTVDVIYPAFPLFLYLYPEYFRLILEPLLVYSMNQTNVYGMEVDYNLAWAPHHLGHWPICDLAPKDQEQMPVEESGNFFILFLGLYQQQGSLDWLRESWPLLKQWADYIVQSLPDPGYQLCTDDFEGPSPHNANLAAKGVVALDAYASLLEAHGDHADAHAYRERAQGFAADWVRLAKAETGQCFRMQFDLPTSWSQKYNLIWQKLLSLSAFPDSAFLSESDCYQGQLTGQCGMPLDDRHRYTKSDWSHWSGAMGSRELFDGVLNTTLFYANVTTSRIPLSDWYDVDSCESKGFQARPVQGALFAKVLMDKVLSSQTRFMESTQILRLPERRALLMA